MIGNVCRQSEDKTLSRSAPDYTWVLYADQHISFLIAINRVRFEDAIFTDQVLIGAVFAMIKIILAQVEGISELDRTGTFPNTHHRILHH